MTVTVVATKVRAQCGPDVGGTQRVVADVVVTTTATEASFRGQDTDTGAASGKTLLAQLGLRNIDRIDPAFLGAGGVFCGIHFTASAATPPNPTMAFVGSSNTVNNNLLSATQNKASFAGRMTFYGEP